MKRVIAGAAAAVVAVGVVAAVNAPVHATATQTASVLHAAAATPKPTSRPWSITKLQGVGVKANGQVVFDGNSLAGTDPKTGKQRVVRTDFVDVNVVKSKDDYVLMNAQAYKGTNGRGGTAGVLATRDFPVGSLNNGTMLSVSSRNVAKSVRITIEVQHLDARTNKYVKHTATKLINK